MATSLGSAISERTEPPLALQSWQRREWEDRWIREPQRERCLRRTLKEERQLWSSVTNGLAAERAICPYPRTPTL